MTPAPGPRLAGIAAVLAAAACATSSSVHAPGAATPSPIVSPPATTAAAPTSMPSPVPTPIPTPVPTPGLTVTVTSSGYGFLAISTAPGAICTASATLSDGSAVRGLSSPHTTGATGATSWTYLQAPTRATNGMYAIGCASGKLHGSATASFQPNN